MNRLLAAGTLAALGAFTVAAQVLLVREHLVVFFGNELVLGLFYGVWFFWLAAGASLWRTLRWKEPRAALEALLVALPPALAAQVLFLRSVRGWIHVPSAELVPIGYVLGVTLAALAPMGLLAGTAFPLACRALAADALGVGRLFVSEAAGAVLAGAAVTFALIPCLLPVHSMAAIALLPLGAAAALARQRGSRRSLAAALGVAAFAVPLAMGDWAQTALDRWRWQAMAPGLELCATEDTPHQNLAVGRRGTQYCVLGDGKILDSFPDRTGAEAEAALVVTQHPAPHRLLVVGGLASGLSAALLRYRGVERVDLLELDPGLARLTRPYLPAEDVAALEDRRVRVHFADVRRFLAEAGRGPYDLVVVQAVDPGTAYLNRLYTAECFRAIRRTLSPDGVLACRVTAAANYLGESVASYGGSVYRTLGEVFPSVALAAGDQVFFFAGLSQSGPTEELSRIIARHDAIAPRTRTFQPQRLASLFDPERVAFTRRRLEDSEAPINRDARPVTYYLNMLLWSHFSGSELVRGLEVIRRSGLPILLVPLGLLGLLAVLHRRVTASVSEAALLDARLAVGVTGLASMASQLVLLLLYQCMFGYLYGRMGLLVALFMLGLAAGAAAANALGADRPRRRLTLLVAANAGFVALLPRTAGLAAFAGEAAFAALVCASGALAGAAFPLALQILALRGLGPEVAAGTLAAFDNAGAGLGAALAGALLVPVFGVEGSCELLAAGLLGTALLSLVPARAAGLPARRESFPYRRLSWSLAALALCVFGGSTVRRLQERGFSDRLGPETLSMLAGRQEYRRVEKPFPHYRGQDAAAALATAPLDPGVRGYGGPMNVAVALDSEGRVRGVRMLEHSETPSYVTGLGAFLARFTGRDTRRELPFSLGEIDGMTGATITSRAAMKLINEAAYRAGSEVLGLRHDRPPPAPAAWWRRLTTPRAAGTLALFALAVMAYLRGGRRLRLAVLLADVALLGWLWNIPFTLQDLGGLSLGRPPGLDQPERLVALAAILASSVAFGQLFCGYLCPFGALQELVNVCRLQLLVSPDLERAARFGKWLVAAVALSGFWLSGRTGWIALEPMQSIFSLRFDAGALALAGAALLFSTVFFRFWCRYLCPTGAVLALGNKLAWLWPRALPRRFDACDLGCRFVHDVDCLRCNRCTWMPPRAGVPSGQTGSGDRIFAVALLVTALLMINVVAGKVALEGVATGGARAISMERVRAGLTRGALSGHEALFYRQAPSGRPASGAEEGGSP